MNGKNRIEREDENKNMNRNLNFIQQKSRGESIGSGDMLFMKNYSSAAICMTDCVCLLISLLEFNTILQEFERLKFTSLVTFL